MQTVFRNLEVTACTDLLMDCAKAKAEEHKVPHAVPLDDFYRRDDVDIVVNLTVPKAHAEVALRAVEAGKSVYNEKPLAVTREDGRKLVELAAAKGLRVGGAPDTFLGGGLQTCRKLIDDGWIGQPVAATAFMTCHGHEHWHPNPEFFYKPGGGPMFDMGPYYVTAMVALMGPARRVTGSARATFPTRTITTPAKYGTVVPVEIPTHVAGVVDFANGAVATIITSFDVWAANLPRIEIYGTQGSLAVPDPNTFGGPVRVRRAGAKDWTEVPLTHGYAENSRGLGVADMAAAIASGRPHRANGELTYHVLDIMHAFHDASSQGRHIELKSTCRQPAPLPLNLMHGEVDA